MAKKLKHKGTGIMQLLDNAEVLWREITKLESPIYASFFVDKNADKDEFKNRMPPGAKIPDWFFAIAPPLKTIYAYVFEPEKIEEHFKTTIPDIYGKKNLKEVFPKGLSGREIIDAFALDNFIYLFHHEIFHPKKAPFGNFDENRITAALQEGIREGSSQKDDLTIVQKVANVSKNLIYDFVLDNIFYDYQRGFPYPF